MKKLILILLFAATSVFAGEFKPGGHVRIVPDVTVYVQRRLEDRGNGYLDITANLPTKTWHTIKFMNGTVISETYYGTVVELEEQFSPAEDGIVGFITYCLVPLYEDNAGNLVEGW